jgi:predicted enzyme related to lactoylglutathione lyase
MTEIIEGMEAVSIHVRDIAKARRFYREVLGLSEVQYDERIQRAVYAIPGTPTVLIMHIKGPEEIGREPGTVTGIVFTHHDPAAACAEIKRRGGTITDEVSTLKLPGRSYIRGVVADPDGNEFIIRTLPKLE